MLANVGPAGGRLAQFAAACCDVVDIAATDARNRASWSAIVPAISRFTGRRRALVGEQGVQEVLRLRVLLEPADEIRDRDVEVLRRNDRRVEQDRPDRRLHGARLRRRHALEHLDVERRRHAATLGEQVRERDVVQVVRGDADAQHAVELGTERSIDEAQVVRVDLGLAAVRRLPPIRGARRRRRSIDRLAPLTSRTLMPAPPAATRCSANVDQAIERRHGVRQVRLQHDPRLEPVELGLGEQRREHLEGQVEVAVLLHVEVDERVRALRHRRPIQRAQPAEHPFDGGRGVPRRDLGDEGGDLDRDVVDVGAFEQRGRARRAIGGLGLAEDRFAEQVHVQTEPVSAGASEMLGQGRIVGVDDEVTDQLAQAPARQRHDDARRHRGDERADPQQQAVGPAEKAGGGRSRRSSPARGRPRADPPAGRPGRRSVRRGRDRPDRRRARRAGRLTARSASVCSSAVAAIHCSASATASSTSAAMSSGPAVGSAIPLVLPAAADAPTVRRRNASTIRKRSHRGCASSGTPRNRCLGRRRAVAGTIGGVRDEPDAEGLRLGRRTERRGGALPGDRDVSRLCRRRRVRGRCDRAGRRSSRRGHHGPVRDPARRRRDVDHRRVAAANHGTRHDGGASRLQGFEAPDSRAAPLPRAVRRTGEAGVARRRERRRWRGGRHVRRVHGRRARRRRRRSRRSPNSQWCGGPVISRRTPGSRSPIPMRRRCRGPSCSPTR